MLQPNEGIQRHHTSMGTDLERLIQVCLEVYIQTLYRLNHFLDLHTEWQPPIHLDDSF